MAEVIGSAGTAVGVVSLGIQVCQGLYTYIDSVRSRDADLQFASSQLRGVVQILKRLQGLLPKIEGFSLADDETMNTLRACMKDSGTTIVSLQTLLQSLEKTPTTDIKGKAKDVGKMLTFSFRRAELASLQDKVSSLTLNVQSALQIVQSYQVVNLEAMVSGLVSAHKDGLTRILSTSGAILTEVTQTRQELSIGSIKISAEIDAQVRTLHDMLVLQKYAPERAALKPNIPNVTRDLYQRQPQLLEKPATLREACDLIFDNRSAFQDKLPSTHLNRWPLCDCKMGKDRIVTLSSTRLSAWTMQLLGQVIETSNHSMTCAWRRTQRRRKIFGQLQVGWTRALSFQLAASLTCTFGAGGFSIAPNLHFKYIVEVDPATNLINELFLDDLRLATNIVDADKLVARAERQILQLFQDGQSSPHNHDSNGWTLMHIIVSYHSLFYPSHFGYQGWMVLILRLLKTLNGTGMPYDVATMQGFTIIDLSILAAYVSSPLHQPRIISLAAEIAPLFNDLPCLAPSIPTSPFILLSLARRNRDLIDVFDLSPLQYAVLSQDEHATRSTLASSPQQVQDRLHSLTILHLSVTWPAGLKLLLATAALELINELASIDLINSPPSFPGLSNWFASSLTPVDLAIYFNCAESLQLLLEHGARWQGFHTQRQTYPSERSARCVAKAVASRRHQLRDIARQELTTIEWLQFDRIEPAQVPDPEAARLCLALRVRGIQVPATLLVSESYENIFMSGNIELAHFPVFFQEGFMDINCRDSRGLLPVMVARPHLHPRPRNSNAGADESEWETFQWLKQHGCFDHCPTDPQLLGLNTTAFGWHYMAMKLAELDLPTSSPSPYQWAEGLKMVRRQILLSEVVDSCDCLCNDLGCSPMHIYLKDWTTYYESQLRPAPDDPDHGFIELPDSSSRDIGKFQTSFIRWITFEALEMTHTCCYGDLFEDLQCCRLLKQYDGNMTEVLSEQKHQVEMLETLMNEFTDLLGKGQERSLRFFILGPWMNRMAEVCVPSEEEYEALAAAGVKVNRPYETPIRLRAVLGRDFDFLRLPEYES